MNNGIFTITADRKLSYIQNSFTASNVSYYRKKKKNRAISHIDTATKQPNQECLHFSNRWKGEPQYKRGHEKGASAGISPSRDEVNPQEMETCLSDEFLSSYIRLALFKNLIVLQ